LQRHFLVTGKSRSLFPRDDYQQIAGIIFLFLEKKIERMRKKNVLFVGIAAGLAAAAAIFFFWKKDQNTEEKPPKKAPQLVIDNPGEQSEFTTSASESEVG
jgi:hypothetical protein